MGLESGVGFCSFARLGSSVLGSFSWYVSFAGARPMVETVVGRAQLVSEWRRKGEKTPWG